MCEIIGVLRIFVASFSPFQPDKNLKSEIETSATIWASFEEQVEIGKYVLLKPLFSLHFDN